MLPQLELIGAKAAVFSVFASVLLYGGAIVGAVAIAWFIFQAFRYGPSKGATVLGFMGLAVGGWSWIFLGESWPLSPIFSVVLSTALGAFLASLGSVEHKYRSGVLTVVIVGMFIFGLGFNLDQSSNACDADPECLPNNDSSAEEGEDGDGEEAALQLFVE